MKRMNMKYQGETSFLRDQLKKKESEFEAEQMRGIKLEAEMVILQEVQQLKEWFRTMFSQY